MSPVRPTAAMPGKRPRTPAGPQNADDRPGVVAAGERRPLREGPEIRFVPATAVDDHGTMLIKAVGYDHPDAVRLVEAIQQEVVERYGGPDETPVSVADFAPPRGLFLVGYVDGTAVACAGWRSHGEHGEDAELKRMYVVPSARGNGYARRLLAEIERTAREAGRRRVILETGDRQPEAVTLYRSAGYTDVEPFGLYACAPESIHLGKVLKEPAPAG